MSKYTWNGNEVIEHKEDCEYYVNKPNYFCIVDKEFYTCKDCEHYDKVRRYDYYTRYENFIGGNIEKFYYDELLDIVKELNDNGINTLNIQQGIGKNEYCVIINNEKINKGE